MYPRLADTYKIVVIEDRKHGKVIGNGTVMIEKKFLRNTGQCAHIEDIVIDKTCRGKSLGLRMIQILMDLTKVNDCYKITLDCEDHSRGFYEKCGFFRKGIQMTWYRDGRPAPKQLKVSIIKVKRTPYFSYCLN